MGSGNYPSPSLEKGKRHRAFTCCEFLIVMALRPNFSLTQICFLPSPTLHNKEKKISSEKIIWRGPESSSEALWEKENWKSIHWILRSLPFPCSASRELAKTKHIPDQETGGFRPTEIHTLTWGTSRMNNYYSPKVRLSIWQVPLMDTEFPIGILSPGSYLWTSVQGSSNF